MKIITINSLIVFIFLGSVFANGPLQDGVLTSMPNHNTYNKNISVNKNTYLSTISKGLNAISQKNLEDTKSVIINYCNIVLNYAKSQIVLEGDIGEEFIYIPNQSLFLFVLCSNVNPSYSSEFGYIYNNKGSYFKNWSFKDLSRYGVYCDVNGNMNNCDLSSELSYIFNEIIGEYVNIKQSNLYGLQTFVLSEDLDGKSLEKQANDFAKFKFGIMLCDVEGEKDSVCNYPKTFRRLKQYMQNVLSLINRLHIINVEKVFLDNTSIFESSFEKKKGYEYMCGDESKQHYNYNIIMCGLFGDQQQSMTSFVNLLYNELFYYRLFVTYYSTLLLNKYDLSDSISLAYAKSKQQKIANEFGNEMMRSQDAISLTIKSLNEVNMTFPIHIGFLMYYEDLIAMRQNLAKMVTPIYTLYDKLRNVQDSTK